MDFLPAAGRLQERVCKDDSPKQSGCARKSIRVQGDRFLFNHEKQKNSDEERENAQAFGERDADENAPELTIGSGGIAQGTQEKIAEN
jgi:hypothetical protein